MQYLRIQKIVKHLILNIADKIYLKEVINMLLFLILAFTIHVKM